MSETPETDALWEGGWNHSELFQLSRKLERERDEARKLAEKWAGIVQDCKWPKEALPWQNEFPA